MPSLIKKLKLTHKEEKIWNEFVARQKKRDKEMTKRYSKDYFNNPEYQRYVLMPSLIRGIPTHGIKKLDLSFQPTYSKGKSEGIMYKACIELQKRQGYTTSRSLAKEVGRTQHRTKQVIRNLVKKGLLTIKSPRHSRQGARYII